VQALEGRRIAARRAALSAAGASVDERRGVFGDAGARVGDTIVASGKRLAVVAELAPHFEPRASLAKRGSVLQRIDERPRAHPVPVLACGVQRCSKPGPSKRVRVPVRPLLIELAPTETWDEAALGLVYDFWWAEVSYAEREACAAAPAS
jgi:hypothetical protein